MYGFALTFCSVCPPLNLAPNTIHSQYRLHVQYPFFSNTESGVSVRASLSSYAYSPPRPHPVPPPPRPTSGYGKEVRKSLLCNGSSAQDGVQGESYDHGRHSTLSPSCSWRSARCHQVWSGSEEDCSSSSRGGLASPGPLQTMHC